MDADRADRSEPAALVAPTDLDEDRVAGAPSDNTNLLEVLHEARDEGFDADFWARESGELLCSVCRTASPAGRFVVMEQRRLEGASDPASMMIIVAGACPACGAKGVATLGYGPDSSAEDAAVVAALA